MSSKDIAIKLAEMLNDKKAEDIVVIDIAEKSSFADFLVVASGTSDRHIESLIDDVEDLAQLDISVKVGSLLVTLVLPVHARRDVVGKVRDEGQRIIIEAGCGAHLLGMVVPDLLDNLLATLPLKVSILRGKFLYEVGTELGVRPFRGASAIHDLADVMQKRPVHTSRTSDASHPHRRLDSDPGIFAKLQEHPHETDHGLRAVAFQDNRTDKGRYLVVFRDVGKVL